MRINLVAPFAEKDAVKALGAKWDSAQKNWYITDVEDLTPFLRWIPNSGAAIASSVAGAQRKPTAATKAPIKQSKQSTIAEPANQLPHCGCDVLPWEHCIHTANL
jgi:Domain of unknown function (DUF5710)